MVRRILVWGDSHLYAPEAPHPSYQLVKKFAKSYKPDVTVSLGDLCDFPYISSFNRENLKVLSGSSFSADFDLANRELDFWQSVSGEYHQVEGNHDERIERACEKVPALDGLINLPVSLHFKSRGVKFHSLLDRPMKLGKLHFLHGYFYNKYSASKHLDVYFHNVIYGHIHKFQTMSKVLPLRGNEEIQAWGIGCLTDRQPDWMKGKPSGWQHGFAVVLMDSNTGQFNLYPVNIVQNRFYWEGKEWKL